MSLALTGISCALMAAPAELNSLRAVKTLENEVAADGVPVRALGTLTFIHRAPFGSFGFVQDEEEALYFQFDGGARPSPAVGSRVEIRGRSFPGEFAPGIRGESIRTVGAATLPEPATRDVGEMMTGRFDSRWVEVEGVVRRLSFDERVQLHILTLASAGARIRAEFPGSLDEAQLQTLIGARISVQGPCGARFNGLRQLIGVRVLVPRLDAVQVLAPAPPVEALSLRPIVSLLGFDPDARPDQAVRVRGVVTALDGDRWVLEDESGGVLVEAWNDEAPPPGALVELRGYITREGLFPVLEDARILSEEPGRLPKALLAMDLTKPEFSLRRVRTQGQIAALTVLDEQVQLVLQQGDMSIPLMTNKARLPLGLAAGATVELVAVVVPLRDRRHGVSVEALYAERAQSVRLVGAGVDRPIQLLVAAPFWNGRRLGVLAASLLGIALLLGGVSLALRRRVARQTVVIREQLEEQRQLRVEAQSANRAKSAFLATMSHELRTPLHGISSTLSLLQDSDRLSAKDREMVGLIEGSSKQLLRIVGDVLDISQAESVGLTLTSRTFNLPRLLTEVVELSRPQATMASLELSLSLDTELPHWVETDPVRLRQILQNLLTNALKFTEKGRIQVRANRDEDDRVRVEVQDSGPGLSESDQVRLFQPFTQAEAGIRRRHDGSGLGLAIARELSELLGGEIGVSSRIGEGATFYFTFEAPMRAPPDSNSRDLSAQPVPSMSVLVVDDNAVNRRVAKAMLERDGHKVTLAEDGREAVVKVADGRFELVLMDLHMPEMDGLEATRVIQSTHEARAPLILGLTADALPSTREACLRAGMRGLLTKPFTALSLRETLAREVAESRP
ncbi:MAG: ATP-binding protein [Myxococcota bacterium]